MTCTIEGCEVCEDGWICADCGRPYDYGGHDEPFHDDPARCDGCAHDIANGLDDAIALAFWRGVCAGIIASRREPLDEAWIMFTHTGAWLYEARFWLAVSRLQTAEGWLK